MSSLLDFELENTPDMGTVKPGEYKLRCKRAEVKDSKAGKPMLVLLLEIPAEKTAYDIRHNVMLPTRDDEEKDRVKKLNRLKDVYKAFGMDLGQKDASAFEGREAWGLIAEEETPDFGVQNSVKKFIAAK